MKSYIEQKEMRCCSKLVDERLKDKLAKMTGQQDMLYWNDSQNKIVKLGCVELPNLVTDILSLVANHLDTDRFKNVQIVADLDNRLVYEL